MKKNHPEISLCLIAKNESELIGDCLGQAHPYCSEMIVVDTGSTDSTRTIAGDFGAKVFDFKWIDDFAAARNFSLAQARGDWILVLDADERITEGDWQKLVETVARAGAEDCFDLEQINYTEQPGVLGLKKNNLVASGFGHYLGYTSSWLTRLFKNKSGFYFHGVVHEHLYREGKLVDGPRSGLRLHHHGQALKAEKLLQKKKQYLELGKLKVEQEPQVAKYWHELGVAAWETGDLLLAQKSLKEALRLAPEENDFAMALASVLQLSGDLNEALGYLENVAQRCPSHPMVHGILGSCEHRRKNHTKALGHFRQQILNNPDFFQARQWLYETYNILRQKNQRQQPTISLCYIVKNEVDCLGKSILSSKEHVDEIIVLDTGSTDRTKEIALEQGARVFESIWRDDFAWARNESLKHALSEWILVLDADEVLAENDWQQIHELLQNPRYELYQLVQTTYSDAATSMNWKTNDLNVPESKGHVGYLESPLVRLFRNTPAIAFVGAVHEHALHRDPVLPVGKSEIRIHHYGKYRGEERMSEKSSLYERIGGKKIREMPNSPQAYHEMAIQLMELGRTGEVELHFKKALELAPQMKEALFGYAGFLMQERRLAESLALYERYLALFPGDAQGYIYMASLLIELKKFGQARELLEKARSLGTEHSVALVMNEGVIALNLGSHDEAREKFREVTRLNPNYAPIWVNLALVEIVQKNLVAAREHLERALKLDQKDYYIHKKLGEILFNQNERERSLEHFLKALELEPGSFEILSQVIICAHSLRREDVLLEHEKKLFRISGNDLSFQTSFQKIASVYATRRDVAGVRRLAELAARAAGGAA